MGWSNQPLSFVLHAQAAIIFLVVGIGRPTWGNLGFGADRHGKK